MRSALRLFVAATTAVFAVTAASATVASAEAPSPDRATSNYEVRFLTGMIDHHDMAVHMAHMCVEKATHEDLRSLCEQIVNTQSSEIEMMQAWLRDWYDVTHEPSMPPGHMNRMERMHAMEPAAFEVMFMQTMIRHHLQAVKEANGCVARAYHEELVTLCQSIIETQSAEIQTMQSWLCQWYGECDHRPTAA